MSCTFSPSLTIALASTVSQGVSLPISGICVTSLS